MYGFDADLDLNDIVGRDLNQICLGRYDVQFVFGATTVVTQGDIEILEDSRVLGSWDENNNWNSLSFQTLLNMTVIGYSVINERTLQVIFSNGLVLKFHDSETYETMQIYRKGECDGPVVI